MKTCIISRREVRIEIPAFKGTSSKFLKKVEEKFAKNDGIMRAIRNSYFCNTIGNQVTLRIATPDEFGYDMAIYSWTPNDIAKKNGLTICSDATPVRLAMNFEEVRAQIPSEYLNQTWWIHMSSIECQTGDKFISGMGCPSAVFEIAPHYGEILDVEWVYGGRRSGVEKDQPMLFECQ